MKYILYALLAWFIYQFIFKLVIPVYKTSRQIKKGFREMQEKMNQQQRPDFSTQGAGGGGAATAERHDAPKSKPPASDYIEFEELK